MSLAVVAVLAAAALGPMIDVAEARDCPPDDPSCTKEPPQNKKVTCWWEQQGIGSTGGAQPPGTPVTGGASNLGAQLLTLHCPNHVLVPDGDQNLPGDKKKNIQWGYKDRSCGWWVDPADCPEPSGAIDVVDLGSTDGTPADPTDCATDHSWEVMAPNVNTYIVFLKASYYKDEDCDGKPDDWNHWKTDVEVIQCFQDFQTGQVFCQPVEPGQTCFEGETRDGFWFCQTETRENCFLPNYYGPKFDPDQKWHNWGQYPAGDDDMPHEPGTPPPPTIVDECDVQTYERQWSQWH